VPGTFLGGWNLMVMKSVGKYLLIGVGFVSLILGIAGIFLPLLPTTPFLLLTAFCFIRGSDHLYQRLIHNKVVGGYIFNYLEYRAVTKKTKFVALIWLWVSLCVSIWLLPQVFIKLILAAIGVAVSIHILSLRSLDFKKIKKPFV
jgi:uncharacterized protein